MQDVFQHSIRAKLVAEFVGTFFLVFTVGCHVHSGNIGAALAIGAVLMVMVYSLGSVSGGHFNPAVTLAVLLSGRDKISQSNALSYIPVQIVGGITGALTACMVFGGTVFLPPTVYHMCPVCAVEVLYTWALCYVILNVATTENNVTGNCPNSFFGLAIGMTVTAAAIAIGPISGCSLNPAVSLGGFIATHLMAGPGVVFPPALHVIQYVSASLIGAVIAAYVFFAVQGGLNNKWEYQVGDIETIVVKPPPPQPVGPRILGKDQKYQLSPAAVGHDLMCGVSWVAPTKDVCDVDLICIKMNSAGKKKDEIYHGHKFGEEDKTGSVVKSIVEHLGDNFEGKGALNETASMAVTIKGETDDERIMIRKLSELQIHQPKCTYMFFVVTMFTQGYVFGDMKSMKLRIVDTQADEELLSWSRSDLKEKSNTIIVGVLYSKVGKWFFRALDEHMKLPDSHKSHHAQQLSDRLSKIVSDIENGVE